MEEVKEIFLKLESNQPQVVEETKKKIHENFNSIRENWLVNGLCEYFFTTRSLRSVEILLGVREPHDKFVFDRLAESMKQQSTKLQALTLLSHLVKGQPTWLFKITQHNLFKELIKILKNETDIVSLITSLLIIIMLLPMLPALIPQSQSLQDIFEVFGRLAAWNTSNSARDEKLLHLQMGLYHLFQRLYGMYPCNFLTFLRQEYSQRENLPVFSHTIKPILEKMRMHPLLVTASKETEIATARWHNKEHHDIMMECFKFSIDSDEIFSSLETAPNSLLALKKARLDVDLPACKDSLPRNKDSFNITNETSWSPSIICGISTPPPVESAPTSIPHTPNTLSYTLPTQEGTSPPEAAIEATPETTPIKDTRFLRAISGVPPTNVARAISVLGASSVQRSPGTPTPTTQSQPSSPMRKEVQSPFRFPTVTFGDPTNPNEISARRDSLFSQKLSRLQQDRVMYILPLSPLPNESNQINQVKETQESQEDFEVRTIVAQAAERQKLETPTTPVRLSGADSIMKDCIPRLSSTEWEEPFFHQENDIPCAEYSRQCPVGGLHMPSSKSIQDFTRHVHQRNRYFSQCLSEPINHPSVRRTHSCPEIKKPSPSSGVFIIETKLDEDVNENEEINGQTKNDQTSTSEHPNRFFVSIATQTSQEFLHPYEHLFQNVMPGIIHSSPSPSPGPLTSFSNTSTTSNVSSANTYAILNKYIDSATQIRIRPKEGISTSLEENKNLQEQLCLLRLQLSFERHLRKVHAERNRRHLGKARPNRVIEEHNSALQDQVRLLQEDFDKQNETLKRQRREALITEAHLNKTIEFLDKKLISLEQELRQSRIKSEKFQSDLKDTHSQNDSLTKDLQQVSAKLFDVSGEIQAAEVQAASHKQLQSEAGQLQRQMAVLGEIVQRQRDIISRYTPSVDQPTLRNLMESNLIEDLSVFQERVETMSIHLEALRSRNVELDTLIVKKEQSITDLKKIIKQTKQEYNDKLEAVESRNQSQYKVNQTLESYIISLLSRVERAETEAEKSRVSLNNALKSLNSNGQTASSVPSTALTSTNLGATNTVNPSTISTTTTSSVSSTKAIIGGRSPDNSASPLSRSLGSPDTHSLTGMLQPGHISEMHNLQVIVDQPDKTAAQKQEKSTNSQETE